MPDPNAEKAALAMLLISVFFIWVGVKNFSTATAQNPTTPVQIQAD